MDSKLTSIKKIVECADFNKLAIINDILDCGDASKLESIFKVLQRKPATQTFDVSGYAAKHNISYDRAFRWLKRGIARGTTRRVRQGIYEVLNEPT